MWIETLEQQGAGIGVLVDQTHGASAAPNPQGTASWRVEASIQRTFNMNGSLQRRTGRTIAV